MEQQSVGITDTLYIEQFNSGIFLRIKCFIHISQYIFHANLFGISYRPYGIELQPFRHRTLENKYRRSTGTGNQIHSLRTELWYRLTEHTVMPGIHHSDTVGTDKRCAIFIYRFKNSLLKQGTFMRFFTKTCRKNNKCTGLFFTCQSLNHIRTQGGRNGKNGKIGIGYIFCIGKRRNSLHFCLRAYVHCLMRPLRQYSLGGATEL